MDKKILLIESDAAFAQPLAGALEARGFAVRLADDGQQALELARAERPDAIVLSAELPRTSGYAICNRLKKDDLLREIPLVMTSAAATPETFEQHRKLKTRAEEYLAKPFAPEALVGVLAGLLGVAVPPPPAAPADEEVVTLDDVEEIESTLAALEAAAKGEGDAAEEDADLRSFDRAFDAIAGEPEALPPANDPAAPPAEEVVPLPLPPAAVPEQTFAAPEPAAPAAVEPEPPAAAPAPATAAAAEAVPPSPDERDAEIARLHDRVSELRVEAARAAEERERLEAKVTAAAADLEEARRRIGELEAQLAKHEQRVLKAYQRMKGDEKVREKTRKALAIALQLLEEGAPAAPPAAPPREG